MEVTVNNPDPHRESAVLPGPLDRRKKVRPLMFSGLEGVPQERSWGSYIASYALQIVGLGILLVYGILAPHIAPPITEHVELIAPDLMPPKPFELAKPEPRKVTQAELREIPVIKTPPKIETPIIARAPERVQKMATVAEVVQPVAPKVDNSIVATLPSPKPSAKIIATNTFGSSAAATLKQVPTSKVQTGGFGDPNGIPANDARGSAKSIAKASGMFDLPVGGGYGNGSGGTQGVRGTVASSGFGNGIAVQPSDRGQGKGKVQATAFASAPPPASDDSHRRQAQEQTGSIPVSIQSKPTPVYTDEARRLRIEGEVLISVVFTSQGQVQIVNVVRGLGHGLDEAAERAARGVKFTPAKRNGQPVDSTAVLHIVFQLS